MNDKIIEAAKEAGFRLGVRIHRGVLLPDTTTEAKRLYAIAYRQGLEDAARLCDEVVKHPAGHQGQWEGYGPVSATRDGKSCAAAIRALMKETP